MKSILSFNPQDELRLRQSPYLQSRWHDWEAWDSALSKSWLEACDADIIQLMGISHLKERHLSQLSNGEYRKARLALALSQHPEELLLVDPFSGLDQASREALRVSIFKFPNISVQESLEKEATLQGQIPRDALLDSNTPEEIFRLRAGQIRYGKKLIFEALDWRLGRGERWRLSGPNGSGKSSLLSLVLGDHPQAYANDLWLLGRKRGAGESLWEWKSALAAFSPELHAHFPAGLSVWDSLASGFFDSMGLFKRPNPSQAGRVQAWLQAFELEAMAEKAFGELGLARQRQVLILRALIKTPALLLLDEPCQGLSEADRHWMLNLFEELFARPEGAIVYVSHREDEIPKGITNTLTLSPIYND